MYARLLAPVCLLSVGAIAESSGRVLEGSDQIAVYLPAHDPEMPAAVVRAMQQETGELMRPGGYELRWIEPAEGHEVQAALLVVVQLKGPCSPSTSRRRIPSTIGRLAFTFAENGRILPFTDVDCSALREFLAPAIATQPTGKRDFLYGRAMGRLLAHELYHLVAQTRAHAPSGVAQASLSVRDLTCERFAFGEEALGKLRRGP